MSEIVTVGKEQWLKISLDTSKRGLLVIVQTHPLVEDFFEQLGNSRKQSFEEIGRFNTWEPVNDQQILSVWRAETPIRDLPGQTFTINNPGGNIVGEDGNINLSFLRICGITEGVQFVSSKEVYPFFYRRELKVRIGNAVRDFVREYIKSARVTLIMTSRED